MANIILSKQSGESELKGYFEAVLKLSQTDNQFPINLEDVWTLAYADKGKAVRALKTNFIEGIDFILLSQNGKQKELFLQKVERKDGRGGHNENTYMLSIPCLEYFIARKVRPVFEVYRKVFHKVVTGRKEVIYTEKEVKKQLLDAEKQIRDAAHANLELQMLNHDLKAKVKILTSLYQEELMKNINTMVFIETKRLTEELEAYMK